MKPLFRHQTRLALSLIFVVLALLAPAGAAGPPWAPDEMSDRARLSKVRRLAKSAQRVPSDRRRTELLDEMIELSRGHAGSTAVVQEAIQNIWALGNRRASRRSFQPIFKDVVAARREVVRHRESALAGR